MKAAVLTDHCILSVEERERPTPSEDDILVQVKACGVCMTDFHMYHGRFPINHPLIPGHESAGEVVAVGDSAVSNSDSAVSVGDRVAINPSIPCHQCGPCTNGMENLCENFTSVGGAADRIIDGAFAEYVRVPAGYVEPIGDLAYRTAAFAEPLACCIHAVDQVDLVSGDTVVIVGAGPIGLLLVQAFRTSGAGTIVVSEPVDERRDLALEVGADFVVDPDETDLRAALSDLVERIDIAVEAVGLPQTIETAHSLPSAGGTTLVFGVPPQDSTIEIDPFDVYYDELELVGTFSLTPNAFSRAVTLLQRGRIDASALITDEYDLYGLQNAFDQMKDKDGLKKMVYPSATD